MPNVPFWNSLAWDTLQLNGVTLPGIWTIGGGVERAVDTKKRKDADGARSRLLGYELGEITLHGKITTPEEWEQLLKLLDVLHPAKKNKKKPPKEIFPIVHPAINALGITQVKVKGIDVPQLQSQFLEIDITVLEYKEPVVIKRPKPTPAQQIAANREATKQDYNLIMRPGQYGYDMPSADTLGSLNEPQYVMHNPKFEEDIIHGPGSQYVTVKPIEPPEHELGQPGYIRTDAGW